jgi:hypothetical protein
MICQNTPTDNRLPKAAASAILFPGEENIRLGRMSIAQRCTAIGKQNPREKYLFTLKNN